MGSHYRNRVGRTPIATTTSSDLAGLGAAPPQAAPVDLNTMTKDQLLEHARSLRVTPANASMTKDELRASINDAQWTDN